jgi:circadian clock protein KaiB
MNPKKPAKVDGTARFEKLLKKAGSNGRYILRLYITGTTQRSTQAIENLRSLCDDYLPGRYDLEVIDIYQQPKVAREQNIIAAPTLVKQFPNPPKRLIGDLSDRDKVLVGLDLAGKSEKTGREKKAAATKWVEL